MTDSYYCPRCTWHPCRCPALPSDDERGLTYKYSHDTVCLLCGRPVGTVDSDTERPPAIALVPRNTRCQACGGRPIFNGEWTRTLTFLVPTGQTRLGRPPKVELGA